MTYEQQRNQFIPIAERMANIRVPIQETMAQRIEWGAEFLKAMQQLWEEYNRAS